MKLLSRALLDELAAKAATHPRARAHHNLHRSADELVQRYFVTANRDSYFRPHRHAARAELAVVVRGLMDLVTFDAAGRVTARYALGEGTDNLGYEAGQGMWHTVIARADGTTFLEIKQGPYDPATAAEYARWAPAEGTPEVARFLEWVRGAAPGDVAPGG